jgi:hypothetical protein
MVPTLVTGRVRATVRLKSSGDGPARVVMSSWSSDRPFPRTVGVGVPFEIETADGAIYRVDPFEALVSLPVRHTAEHAEARHEEAWIAAADEIAVEGELERAGRTRLPPTLHARRIASIASKGAAALHRLPPRTLQRGESEKLEAPPPLAAATPPPVAAATPPPVAAATPAVPAATAPAAPELAPPRASMRMKKRRPDAPGAPPPPGVARGDALRPAADDAPGGPDEGAPAGPAADKDDAPRAVDLDPEREL